MKKRSSIVRGGVLGIAGLAIAGLGFALSSRPAVPGTDSGNPFESILREAQAQTAEPQAVEAQVAESDSAGATPEEAAPASQPIAFPHDRHARDFQIDCQYCHFSVERSMSAGIPPVATCMGCHSFVSGSQNPDEIVKLRGYAERGEPIPWNRIYKVADHVQFPHMRHISAGVNCTACHGNVQGMGVIEQVNQPLTMGWCVNCHVALGASRDCTVCHY
ncbi:MAG: cytochrome c3 family protein [Gemmatimonadota bacterium]